MDRFIVVIIFLCVSMVKSFTRPSVARLQLSQLTAECRRGFSAFSTAKNARQHTYLTYLHDPAKKIVLASGPAGTGKTLLATQAAVQFYLRGTVEKLIFTRPTVSVDEDLGALPGSLEEKMAPWMRPIYDVLYEQLTPPVVSKLIANEVIEISPLGFMRGRTFKNCCIVADECQNCTENQMKMLLTRLGENSRLFVTGDLDQCDLKLKNYERSGLEDFLTKFRGKQSDRIASVEFEIADCQREAVVEEVLEIYSARYF
jgi:phosphate starvation-inducible PhoH-like protein